MNDADMKANKYEQKILAFYLHCVYWYKVIVIGIKSLQNINTLKLML